VLSWQEKRWTTKATMTGRTLIPAACWFVVAYRDTTHKALFSSEKISDFATVAILFLFDKYCPIIN